MTLVKSLVQPLVRPLSRSMLAGGGIANWAPTRLGSNLLQFFESPAYASSNIAGIPVLADSANTGTLRQPRQGRAYLFDGTDDYINVTTTDFDLDSSWRCEVHVNLSSLVSNKGIIGNRHGIGTNYWQLSTVSGTTLRLYCIGDAGLVLIDVAVSTGQWYTVVVSYDEPTKTFELFVDDVSKGTITITDYTASGRDIHIGSEVGYMAGKLKFCEFTKNGVAQTTYLCNEEAGTTAYDSSGNGNNGTITNATLSTFHATDTGLTTNPANQAGQSGAFYFDGTNDYISLEDGVFDSHTVGTITGRVKFNDLTGAARVVFGNVETSPSTNQIQFSIQSSGKLVGYIGDSAAAAWKVITDAVVVTQNQYHHVALVQDGVSPVVYIDGVAPAQSFTIATDKTQWFSSFGAANEYSIGRAKNSGGDYFLSGTLSDVRVYDSALSAAEILALHSGTDPAASPVGHWLLNNGLAKDTSGNGNHGTISGAMPVIIPRDESDTANDVTGSALDYTGKCPMSAQVNVPCGTFDGTDDYVDIDPGPTLAADFSASMWVKPASTTGKRFFAFGASGLNLVKATTISVDNSGGPTSNIVATPAVITDWHHVVVTRSGTTYTLYVDSVSAGTSGGTAPTYDEITVGAQGGSYGDCSISDLRIYSDVLTADEITHLYTNGASGTDPTEDNLVGHWPFEEGAGNTIHDIAGDNHGTVTNATLSNFWANKTTVTRDYCIENGGMHAAYCPGSPDQIYHTTYMDTVPTAFSVCGWAKMFNSSTGVTIISKENVSNSDRFYLGLAPLGYCFFDTHRSGGSYTALNGTIADPTDGNWYHVVGTWDTVNGKRLYVNGVLENSDGAETTLMANGSGADLKCFAYNASSTTYYTKGYARDVRVYEKALTADEVAFIHSAGATGTDPTTDDLGLQWEFEKNANDFSGNNRNGTATSGIAFPFVYNATNYQTPRVASKVGNNYSTVNWNPYTAAELNAPLGVETAYTIGKSRQSIATVNTKFRRSGLSTARQFTAANSEYFTIADNASLQIGEEDFYVAGWAYHDNLTGYQTLAAKWNVSGQYIFYIYKYTGTGSYRFGVRTSGDATVEATATTVAVAGGWYFVEAYYDSSATESGIALNGEAFVTATITGGVKASQTAPFSIGGYSAGQFQNGRLARVGFWKRTLTAAERTALYNSGEGLGYNALTTPLKTSLVSYWNLDEASGNALDSHGTNHLTDTNTVTAADGPDRSSDGDDRFVVTSAALTGSDLTNMRKYVQ